jgi:hypothetical protein
MFFRDDVAFDESTVGSGSYAEYETGSEESEDEGLFLCLAIIILKNKFDIYFRF